MRSTSRHQRPVQLKMFQPPSSGPQWQALLAEAKRRALALLVQLLKEHHIGHPVPVGREGASDE